MEPRRELWGTVALTYETAEGSLAVVLRLRPRRLLGLVGLAVDGWPDPPPPGRLRGRRPGRVLGCVALHLPRHRVGREPHHPDPAVLVALLDDEAAEQHRPRRVGLRPPGRLHRLHPEGPGR